MTFSLSYASDWEQLKLFFALPHRIVQVSTPPSQNESRQHASVSFFCFASSVSESYDYLRYLIHFFVIQVLQHSRHSRIHWKVSLKKLTKRMFLKVEAESEVYCHIITSGAASTYPRKVNKITTEGFVPQILYHQRHCAIGNFQMVRLFNQRTRNKKLTSPTMAMAPLGWERF